MEGGGAEEVPTVCKALMSIHAELTQGDFTLKVLIFFLKTDP